MHFCELLHLITKFCFKVDSIYLFMNTAIASSKKIKFILYTVFTFCGISLKYHTMDLFPTIQWFQSLSFQMSANFSMISIFVFSDFCKLLNDFNLSFFLQISANFSDSRYRPWPRVKQFLMDLEPGAFVCDVGQNSPLIILIPHASVERSMLVDIFYWIWRLTFAITRSHFRFDF